VTRHATAKSSTKPSSHQNDEPGERLSLSRIAVTSRTGLRLPSNLPLSGWRRIGQQIFLIADSSAWWIGDWLVFGEDNYPDRYREAMQETQLEYQTLKNYSWVARRFPLGSRRQKLSFQHHVEVAALPPADRDLWLDRAQHLHWSRNELRRQLRQAKRGAHSQAPSTVEFRLDVEPGRLNEWRSAAQAAGKSLSEWLGIVLDSAALAILDGNHEFTALGAAAKQRPDCRRRLSGHLPRQKAARMNFPHIIRADNGADLLIDILAAQRQEILTRLRHSGAVLMRGFDVGGVDGFASAVRILSGEPLSYNERSSPRHSVKGNVYTSTDYPPTEEIFFHNENSYQTSWPLILFFYCVQPARQHGATPLSDTRHVLRILDPSVREEFTRRRWMLVRNFDSRIGMSWQQVFDTQDRGEVMRYCAAHSIDAEWRDDGRLRTTAVRSAVQRHPWTGDEVWFNHAAFFHLSTLPHDTQEALRELFSEEDLPSNTYFGDGTPIPDEVVDHVRACYRAAATRFDYHEGDVLVVDNMLTSHGREPFSPPREVLVAMAELIAAREEHSGSHPRPSAVDRRTLH
jgi:alpha-ketoglutarate-dependent taurine dioxygenase